MELARDPKGARFAVWKNPENLTERQQAKLPRSRRPTARSTGRTCSRSSSGRSTGCRPSRPRSSWSSGWPGHDDRGCRRFVKLARTITAQRDAILSAVKNGLSNARIEQMNTQIRLLARQAFGFHSPRPLIALAMLKLAGLCPPLPR